MRNEPQSPCGPCISVAGRWPLLRLVCKYCLEVRRHLREVICDDSCVWASKLKLMYNSDLQSREINPRIVVSNSRVIPLCDFAKRTSLLAHLSVTAVRDFYERTCQDCRLVFTRLQSPRKMQTLTGFSPRTLFNKCPHVRGRSLIVERQRLVMFKPSCQEAMGSHLDKYVLPRFSSLPAL